MPVKSYLVCAKPGGGGRLAKQLGGLPGCTIWPAENREALVVVTDTVSEDSDALLRHALEGLESLGSLTLVAAFAAADDLVAIGKSAHHEPA